MLKDITLGQYYPTDSVVHRLDPRTKFIFTFVYIIVLFAIQNFIGFGVAFAFLAFAVYLSKIPVGYILRGIKALVFIILFTVCINMFFTPGHEIFRLGFLKITIEGVRVAVFMALRLIMLVTGTSLMTLATSPIALTDGMETLMMKVPLLRNFAHELSMMMSIALRFIPTLMEETNRIMDAQKARGADFESGNLLKRAKALIPVLVPLFVSAFQRAEELAMAMEARCYRGGKNRTRMKALAYQKIDRYGYLFTAVMTAAIIAANFI